MNKPRRLFVEGLESRAMLAGNVQVSVSDGTLNVIGSDHSNGVSIQQIDSGRFFITGFTLGGSNTTINGQQSRIVSGVSNINVDLNAGHDVLVMNQDAGRRAALAAELSGNTAGPIANSPEAPNPNTTETFRLRIIGNVNVDTDEGNDGVGISARIGNAPETLASLNIETHGGGDRVILERVATGDDVLINTGHGTDIVRTWRVGVYDFFFADLGADNDAINVDFLRGFHAQIFGGAGADQLKVNDVGLGEELFLYGNSGNDTLDANDVVADHITLAGHDGHDTITMTNSHSHHNTLVDGGAHRDTVNLRNVDVGVDLLVFMGAGIDRLNYGSLRVHNHATLDGGADEDSRHNDGGNNFNSLHVTGFEKNV